NDHQQFDQCEAAARPPGGVLGERHGVAPGVDGIDGAGIGLHKILPLWIRQLPRPAIRGRDRSIRTAASRTSFMDAESSTQRAKGERLSCNADDGFRNLPWRAAPITGPAAGSKNSQPPDD